MKKKVTATAAAALILAALSFAMSSVSGSLEAQNMAGRWQNGELKYSQVSVFYPKGMYGSSETETMRGKITEAVKAGAFRPENEDAKIWIDSYCSVITVSDVYVYDDRNGKTNSAGSGFSVMGVGGEFFEFHPLKLISGNYIYDDELRNDRAVLDEQAAWDIFSSFDVVGMKFQAGGMEFEVAGVVKAEENRFVKKAYPESPLIYVHYDALAEARMDKDLLCYEAVLPDPVSNYAKNIILEKFGVNTMTVPEDGKDPEKKLDVLITENSTRYSLPSLWAGLKNFDMMSVQDKCIAFPYWENAARMAGVRMEILFFFSVLLFAFIIIMLCAAVCRLYLNRKWHLGEFLEDMMYRYTYRKRTSDYISTPLNKEEAEAEAKYEQ
jgi:hypothetical protein